MGTRVGTRHVGHVLVALLVLGTLATAGTVGAQGPWDGVEERCGPDAYGYWNQVCLYHCNRLVIPFLGDAILVCQYNNYLCRTPLRGVSPFDEHYLVLPNGMGTVKVSDCRRSDGRCVTPDQWGDPQHALLALYVCDWGAA